jgi:hypothetical protein
VALPLTLYAQWARAAVTETCRIHHEQAPVSALFAAPGGEAHGLLGTGGFRRAGEGSQRRCAEALALTDAPVPASGSGTHCEMICQHSCPQAECDHQRRFKGTAMQIQFDDIAGGEPPLRKAR